MAGEFGSGPKPKKLPHGHKDVIQPFEAPEHYDAAQRRKVEKAVGKLVEECGLRSALTEDLAKRPGSYLIRLIGTEADINVFIAKLSTIVTD